MLDIGHGWTAVLHRTIPNQARPFFPSLDLAFGGYTAGASRDSVRILSQNPDWLLEHQPNVSVWNKFSLLDHPSSFEDSAPVSPRERQAVNIPRPFDVLGKRGAATPASTSDIIHVSRPSFRKSTDDPISRLHRWRRSRRVRMRVTMRKASREQLSPGVKVASLLP